MKPKLAIRIQHSPHRSRYLNTLLINLGIGRDCTVINDNVSTISGCLRCLSSMKKEDTHVLVIQDDGLPCDKFILTVQKLIELYPDRVMSFFSVRDSIKKAVKENYQFVRTDYFLGAVCYVIPRSIVEDFLKWYKKYIKESIKADDECIATYLFYHNIKTYITTPNLIEHIGFNASTQREGVFKFNHRVSSGYIGLESSGLLIPWENDRILDDYWAENSMMCSNLKIPIDKW